MRYNFGSRLARLKILAASTAIIATLALPAVASADTCSNVSRAAPKATSTTSAPVTKGNWVWLPSIGVQEQAWGFAPPGTTDSKEFGFPGANGNYTNGKTNSLLGVSAYCTNPTKPGANQTTKDHGIVSGCGG